MVATFGLSLSDPTTTMDCERANRSAAPGIVVSVCQHEYERTRDPVTGGRLADALRVSGRLDAASAVARGLLTTSVRGDAFQILGKIAIAERRMDDAVTALEAARAAHRERGDRGELARDGQALARVFTERERFAEALYALDECIVEAKAVRDGQTEGYCRLSAARVLTRVGYFELAQQELGRAEAFMHTDRDRAWLFFERGNIDQEVARAPLRDALNHHAISSFEQTVTLATRAGLTELVLYAEMNLAYSSSEIGKVDDADRHLATAKSLDLDNEYATPRRALAARIAFRRGNPSLATTLNDEAYAGTEVPDDRSEIATMQARIAIQSGNLVEAERWARLGIVDVETVRDRQSTLELRPWVLATRREPYELLFAVLARAGRHEDALLVFTRWQGRTLLDALARPSDDPSIGLRGTAKRVERITSWLPGALTAPFAKRSLDRASLGVLSKVDLLALVIAEHRVYSIISRAGAVRVRDLGSYETLRDRLTQFATNPTDRALATELGALLLVDDLRGTSSTLHVLLDGPLAALPIAALRSNGKPLIQIRPIVRILYLPDAPCVRPSRQDRATVIADAVGDLPSARIEANEVAAVLGSTPSVGAAATRQVLFASARDTVLHVAVHTELTAGGAVLKLYDEPISALEIYANKLGPSLVMMSSCDSASSRDGELAGSFATAFLAGGSQQVVATLRPVSDTGAHELVSRFYRDGGVADPVRVLAAIQTRLADTANTDWPSFAVFGHDVCRLNQGE